ncbi:MAG: hypothetical protein U9R79_14460 [Armatimonadota bacterium]|nr:hypothetical protein [Armatimonadota bacterium]
MSPCRHLAGLVRGPALSSIALIAALLAPCLAPGLAAQPDRTPEIEWTDGALSVELATDLVARGLCQVEVDEQWVEPQPAGAPAVQHAHDRLTASSTYKSFRLSRTVRAYPGEALVLWRAEVIDDSRHRMRVGLALPLERLRSAPCQAWVFSGRAGQQMDFELTGPDAIPPPLNREGSHNLNMGLHSLVAHVGPDLRVDTDSDRNGRWSLYWTDDEVRLISMHWSVGPDRPLMAVARLQLMDEDASPPRPRDLADLVDGGFTFTAAMSRRGFYFDRQPVEVQLHALSLDPAPERRVADLAVIHQDGREVLSRRAEVLPAGRREHHVSVPVEPPRRGMYRVRVQSGPVQREVTFGVIPRPSGVGNGEASIFGIHAILSNPHYPHLAEQMGMRWERLWGGNISNATLWHAVEPEPGTFAWRDEHIALARRHNLRILGMLGGRSPEWLARPLAEWGDEELAAWRRYVSATVGHYRGDIDHWEVLNEPYGSLRPDQADIYVRVLRAAWEAAKEANPDAVIVGVCGPPSAARWYEPVFEVGGLEYLDAVSSHLYPPGGGTAALDFDETLRDQIAGIRDLMRQYGEVKPLWDTETGIGPATPFNQLKQPRYFSTYGRPVPVDVATDMVARLYIVHVAEGVPMFYYLLHGSYEYAYALCENDGSPMPQAASLAVAESVLDGAEPVAAIEKGPARCYAFRRLNRGIIAVWGVGLKGREPTLKASFRPEEALDVMGNSVDVTGPAGELEMALTQSPVYLRMAAEHLPDALGALRDGPDPVMATLGAEISGVYEEPIGRALAVHVSAFEPEAIEFAVELGALPAGWRGVDRLGYGAQDSYVVHGARTLLFPIERAPAAAASGEVTVTLRRGDEVITATERVTLPDGPAPEAGPHVPGVEMAHTGVEHTKVGRWTIQSSRSGLQNLYRGEEPLMEGFYFYVARRGLNQALVGFRGSQRTIEQGADAASVVLSNQTQRGSCELTARASREEVALRWELHVEPIKTGWGELGVYIPERVLNNGYPCELRATLRGGHERELLLSAETPMDQLDQVQALRFSHPRGRWSIELDGFEFIGSHGWHFQDYRENARHPGRYRLVLSFSAEEGFDAHLGMAIRAQQ